MSGDPRSIAQTYFSAWLEHDWERLRGVLADDVTFDGVLGKARGADECLGGLKGMAKGMDGIDIPVMVVDGKDVITWYDMRSGDVTNPTANWSHVENGKITAIRAVFDPRPLLAG